MRSLRSRPEASSPCLPCVIIDWWNICRLVVYFCHSVGLAQTTISTMSMRALLGGGGPPGLPSWVEAGVGRALLVGDRRVGET